MKSIALFVILAIGATILVSCANLEKRLSIEEEYKSSTVVFLGTVTSANDKATPNRDDPFSAKGTFYLVQVNQVFKGILGKSVQVYSENSSLCFPMSVGDSYLVFASKLIFGDKTKPRYAINNTGNSKKIIDAKKTIEVVQMLAKKEPNRR